MDDYFCQFKYVKELQYLFLKHHRHVVKSACAFLTHWTVVRELLNVDRIIILKYILIAHIHNIHNIHNSGIFENY